MALRGEDGYASTGDALTPYGSKGDVYALGGDAGVPKEGPYAPIEAAYARSTDMYGPTGGKKAPVPDAYALLDDAYAPTEPTSDTHAKTSGPSALYLFRRRTTRQATI